ncbi:MAG: polyketide cyclase [Chloroflexi bacterium]|nr:polyketide cyclase [Chloroflexota bacterium]
MSGRTTVTAEPGTTTIEIIREFDAPRDLVFRAHTEPDLLRQWLGPRRYEMRIDRFEARDGGRYRYRHVDPDSGAKYGFRGVFHGDPSPDLWVQTFEFDGWPGHVSMDTLRLEDRGGQTISRTTSAFSSVEDRDGMISSGMEDGLSEGYERLDELLVRLGPIAARS